MRLTRKRLKEALNYNPETGQWIWLKPNKYTYMKKGDKAGHIDKNGYRIISLDGNKCRSSRLAFLYMEGYLPEYDVDHKDRIRNNDRWL